MSCWEKCSLKTPPTSWRFPNSGMQWKKRGFGPMLALPAFIAATPIGAIPGVPTITGVTILLIAMQILLGRRHPWLPATIMKIEMDAERIEFLVNKMKPVAVRFDRFLMPRWFYAPTCVPFTYSAKLCGVWFVDGATRVSTLYGINTGVCCVDYGYWYGNG